MPKKFERVPKNAAVYNKALDDVRAMAKEHLYEGKIGYKTRVEIEIIVEELWK